MQVLLGWTKVGHDGSSGEAVEFGPWLQSESCRSSCAVMAAVCYLNS